MALGGMYPQSRTAFPERSHIPPSNGNSGGAANAEALATCFTAASSASLVSSGTCRRAAGLFSAARRAGFEGLVSDPIQGFGILFMPVGLSWQQLARASA